MEEGVRGLEPCGRVGHGGVHGLSGLSVEVTAHYHGLSAAVGLKEGEQILALLIAEGGEEGALPGLEVSREHHQTLPAGPLLKH